MRTHKVRSANPAKGSRSDKGNLKEQLAKAGAKGKPKGRMELEDIEKLVENGNKEQWKIFIAYNLKNELKMNLPPLEAAKCKFPEYGYRQLIELILESTDFLGIIIEIQDVSEFQMVSLNHLIRGDDPTLRGLEALCGLIVNTTVRYNPVSETDFKYLNIILDSFAIPKKVGINKTWNIKTENKETIITANFNKSSREWVYKYSVV
jgi:hypothetical protein